MPAVLGGGSRLQFEISKNGGETWDAAGQVTLLAQLARYTSHATPQFMSSSSNVLVSASFPSAVSSDWQIRVVLIACGSLPAAANVPKVQARQ